MSQPLKRSKLNNNESQNIFVKNENSMSVHNISMNAILCSSLNLDSIYKYFSNCIYNPREFKCMRIDVPVSLKTVHKYVNYVKNKRKKEQQGIEVEINKPEDSSYKGVDNNCKEVSNNCDMPSGGNTSFPIDEGKCSMPDSVHVSSTANIASSSNAEVSARNDHISGESNYINSVIEKINENYKDVTEKLVINVSIFSNGKIICTGNNSIEACKIAMKKVEKKLKQLNFKNIKLKKITIANILAVYNVGFSIVLPLFAQYYKSVDYDPNVFPACKVKIALTNEDKKNLSERKEQNESTYAWCNANNNIDSGKSKVDIVSASIFSTGNITLTGGKSYENLQRCIDILFPYLIKSKSQH
ncbi:transcription initiation TFIID-like [Plasmodium brasilianum]|uniref:Transcription initiation TFIID-like, putative n=2 Tax=Plasmodium (Plasmodium) TaxID=418103 RepID=A0A1A8WE96_PLAMA|nr:transcription initiation TFIID-like, putative [Plasmodium malariae]KAI4835734.1 transcription initiation TFIID-like [Plasmodium brasilianum]SBS89515.1 transcription initiation TFIID-like, putative [Plasmodium malariae]SCP02666.1 transcription initiation TFIID-like, putative [Plasmodium malariae]